MSIINVGTWNLESGDSDINLLEKQVYTYGLFNYDIWGFTEVKNNTILNRLAKAFTKNSGDEFKHFIGDTANQDKIGIIYNSVKYELIKEDEIDSIDLDNPNHRDTLLGYFKKKNTGKEFIFASNHFARGDREKRLKQVQIMNMWSMKHVEKGTLIIAVGDYNFDWDIKLKKGNRSFDNFMSYDIYDWIMPKEILETYIHRRYNSILDFIFFADPNDTIIKATSEIMLKDIAIDTIATSDHRPVVASIQLTS